MHILHKKINVLASSDNKLKFDASKIKYNILCVIQQLYQNKYKIQYKWRDRAVVKADTCWRDSVVTEYKEKVVEVTKIPKIYHATMLFSIFCIIFASIKLARWLKIR